MKKIFVLLLMTVFMLSACSASKGEDDQSIEPGTEQYKQIAESNIEAVLAEAFGINSIYDDGVDLSSCSEKFLKEIGMNDDEISSLRESLAL